MLTKTLRQKSAYRLILLIILLLSLVETAQARQTPITAQNASQLAEVRRFGTGALYSVSWSPDSQSLLYGGAGLWFYDLATAAFTGHQDTGTFVEDARYSPDGTRIATANLDGTVRLYDAASGAVLWAVQAYPRWALRVAYSPDGSLIAATGGSEDPTVYVWEAATGRERLVFHDFRSTVWDLKFSPDGTRLAAAGPAEVRIEDSPSQVENVVLVWDVPGGDLQSTLYGPEGQIDRIDFHPDGQQIIAASWDGILYHWTLDGSAPGGSRRYDDRYADPDRLAPGSQDVGNVLGVAYSPAGWIAALSDRDLVVYFEQDGAWVSRGYQDAFAAPATFFLNFADLEFSPDGQRLLVSPYPGIAGLWDAGDLTTLHWIGAINEGHNDRFARAALSPDGSLLAAAEVDRGLGLWDTVTGEAVTWNTDQAGMSVNDLAFDPGGHALALAQTPAMLGYGATPTAANYPLLLWERDPAVDPLPLTEPGGRPLYALAFNADGSRLFTGGDGGHLRAWDAASRSVVAELDLSDESTFSVESVYGLAVNPAGSVVAFLDGSRSVRLWDVAHNVELPALTGPSESVQAAAFRPDGTHLAAVDSGATLIVWDTASWAETWYLPQAGGSTALAYSPDGSLLAVAGDGGVTLWEIVTRQKVFTLTQQPGGIADLAFSADGTLLVTAGGDGTVRLWAVAPGAY